VNFKYQLKTYTDVNQCAHTPLAAFNNFPKEGKEKAMATVFQRQSRLAFRLVLLISVFLIN